MLISKKSSREIKALLGKAFTDLDFATDLLKPYVDKQQEIVSKSINSYLVNAFGEKVREEIKPEISVEFPDADIDETGTIQPKEVPVSGRTSINPASDRFASAMPNSLSMQGTGTTNQATADRGRQIFGQNDPIFAAQGGIMNARKQIQRVA